jgi:hypothetical protein
MEVVWLATTTAIPYLRPSFMIFGTGARDHVEAYTFTFLGLALDR